MIRFFVKAASAIVLVGSMIALSGCPGTSEGTDPMKVQLGKLSKTWSIVSADLDGDDRTGAFTGFKLTISGTFNKSNPPGPYTYSVSGSMQEPNPWDPTGGEWTFNSVDKGANSGTMVRNDGVPMTYSINSSGQLTLGLQCSSCAYPGARVATVNGQWTFVLQ